MIFPGFPTHIEYGGTSFVTTHPAPMIAPAPIVTDDKTTELFPTQQSGPITV